MNIIDLLLLFVVMIMGYAGWHKGFIVGAIELLSLIVSIAIAFLLYPYFASFIGEHWPALNVWTNPLAFIGAFIIGRLIISFLANRLLINIPATAHLSLPNRVMGIVPGVVNGSIWAMIIATLLLSFPFSNHLLVQTRQSIIANKLATQVEWINEQLLPIVYDDFNIGLNRLLIKPKSEERIDLPFTHKDPEPRPELEFEMLQLINEERTKAGLMPVKADKQLLPVARAHARDMFARGYFSHISPEGKTPFDRIRAAKISFITAGENLALGQTLAICHNGLMHSPGHRANILNAAFGRVAIGIVDGGLYGLMITQNFRN